MQVTPYQGSLKAQWDAFVRNSCNGTFLFERGYMEYHSDRFTDASLIVERDGEWLAALPAHRSNDSLVSHGGLTYGGWIVSKATTTPDISEAFDALAAWMSPNGLRTLTYRPVPFIYARGVAQADLFCLFQRGARLTRRDALSVIDLRSPAPVQKRRARGVKKATDAGIEATRDDACLPEYWTLLERNLAERHQATPVHSFGEMRLLQSRFPEAIRLYVARRAGQLLAGVLIYETETSARTQYIASSPEGRAGGAVDLLIQRLALEVYAHKHYLDLGSSMRGLGELDLGLIEQKEGFGARTVALDTWEWTLP